MEKYVQLPSYDKAGNPLVEAIRFPAPGVGLEKTASLKYAQLEPEMRDFVSNLKPVEGKLFVLVNALGAYEYWGANHNADAFREEVLANTDSANGYRTFLKATVFRHHCFPAGTTVVRDDHRRVGIETITTGDRVLSSAGAPVDVVRVMSRQFDGPGRALTMSGVMESLVGTDDHPVLVLKREQVHCRHKYSKLTRSAHAARCKELQAPVGGPTEVPLKDVRVGDYMLRPKVRRAETSVAPEFARLVGWVASEGYLGSKGLIQFTFSENNQADITAVTACLRENGLHVTTTPRKEAGTVMLSACKKALWEELSSYVTGVKSEKTLTKRVFDWDEPSLLQMLGTYVDGDGHVARGRNSGQLRIRSSSRQMLCILSDIVLSLGVPATVNWDHQPGEMKSPTPGYGNYWSEGSGCLAVASPYSAALTVHSRKHATKADRRLPQENRHGDWYLTRVLSNEPRYISEPVFNLEVTGDHTYLAGEVAVHNCNKNPEGEGFGRIVVAVYNPRMHRVELLLEIDRAKADLLGHTDLIERLDAGENPAVSMGMRTSYDVCSWCGNKSYKADGSDKCRHLKPLRMGGDGSKLAVREDGVVCCMFNVRFVGFDLSFVDIGADSTSFSIAKVARKGGVSVTTGDSWQAKLAEIIKRIPAMSAFEDQDPFLGYSRLSQLAQMGTPSAVASTARAGIILKPEEFQWLTLNGAGHGDMADSLMSQGMVAGDCPAGVSSQVRIASEHPGAGPMDCVAPWMPSRSVYEPFLNRPRTLNIQLTLVPFGTDPLLSQVSRAYDGYRRTLACCMPILAQQASMDPSLGSMLHPDWLLTQGIGPSKVAAIGPKSIVLMGVLPAAYLLNRVFNKEGESGLMQFVKDHPIITTSFLVGALGATK